MPPRFDGKGREHGGYPNRARGERAKQASPHSGIALSSLIEDPMIIRCILDHPGLWAPIATERGLPLGPAS